jgi:tetratricopeptide (TPR) repeat protein
MASVQSSADDVSIIQSSSADTLVSLGKVAYSKGELDEARELWEAAIERDASNPAAHYQLGLLAKRQSYLSEACAFFRHAIDVNHVQSDDKDDANNIKNDDIQYELGVVLVQMGYIPEADAIFRDIVSREPSVDRPSKVKLALANLILDGRGKRSEALQVYAQACRAGSSPMAFLAGVTADSMGDHSAALEFYQTSYDASPDDEDTALHLMVAHLREGNHAAAATLRSRLASHALSSLDYVLSTLVGMDPSMQFFTYDMIHLALKNTRELTTEGGLVLEFGVYHGKTLRMIASHFPNIVHGKYSS